MLVIDLIYFGSKEANNSEVLGNFLRRYCYFRNSLGLIAGRVENFLELLFRYANLFCSKDLPVHSVITLSHPGPIFFLFIWVVVGSEFI